MPNSQLNNQAGSNTFNGQFIYCPYIPMQFVNVSFTIHVPDPGVIEYLHTTAKECVKLGNPDRMINYDRFVSYYGNSIFEFRVMENDYVISKSIFTSIDSKGHIVAPPDTVVLDLTDHESVKRELAQIVELIEELPSAKLSMELERAVKVKETFEKTVMIVFGAFSLASVIAILVLKSYGY